MFGRVMATKNAGFSSPIGRLNIGIAGNIDVAVKVVY